MSDITKEDIENFFKQHTKEGDFPTPISNTHIKIGGAIINASEFDKAMREEFERLKSKTNE